MDFLSSSLINTGSNSPNSTSMEGTPEHIPTKSDPLETYDYLGHSSLALSSQQRFQFDRK